VVVHPGGASPAASPPPPGRVQKINPPAGSAAAPVNTTDLVIEEVVWLREYLDVAEETPRVMVTIRNDGTARWASSGKVVVVMELGTPREIAAAAASGARHQGVSVVSGSSRRVSTPRFGGSEPIRGSLAPGAKTTVQVKVRMPAITTPEQFRDTLPIEADKYYTIRVDLRVMGDDQGTNNGADLVLRFDKRWQDAGGLHLLDIVPVEPVLTQRRTDTSGTVEVRAPPGR